MKKIKISYVDFWANFDKENFIASKILSKFYDLEYVSPEEADYVFFSDFGIDHWFLPDDSIKIFYIGENNCPDFNICDYAIGFEWLDYGDRYMRLPNYYATPFYQDKQLKFEQRYFDDDKRGGVDPQLSKRQFCSFVVSNCEGSSVRGKLFELLSEYRTVDSGGRWQNNVGGPVEDKLLFESQHKFSICCENSSHAGYTTEKIIEAFAARVIPIYWGDPLIGKVINTKAFINVLDYPSLDAVVERVKYLDNNDEAYLSMLNEHALINPIEYSLVAKMEEVQKFLINIIEQPKHKAVRYNRDFWGQKYIDRQKTLIEKSKKSWRELLKESIKARF